MSYQSLNIGLNKLIFRVVIRINFGCLRINFNVLITKIHCEKLFYLFLNKITKENLAKISIYS